MVSQLIITLTILMIPGIIAVCIFDAITQHEQWNNFTFSVYAILFSWLSYIPLWLCNKFSEYFCPCLPQFTSVRSFLNLEKTALSENIYFDILAASFFSIIIVYLASYCVNHKYLTKLANRLGISDKYGDESLFYYYLNEWNRTTGKDEVIWISVTDLRKNKIYTGGLGSYSEKNGFQELLLINVDVYGENTQDYRLDNIYICGKIGDFSIEPLKTEIGESDNV